VKPLRYFQGELVVSPSFAMIPFSEAYKCIFLQRTVGPSRRKKPLKADPMPTIPKATSKEKAGYQSYFTGN
jgi:hypothetical protein